MGTTFQGKYSDSIKAAYVYPSSNFLDDLAWGAAWLYRKTGEQQFLSVRSGAPLCAAFRVSLLYKAAQEADIQVINDSAEGKHYRIARDPPATNLIATSAASSGRSGGWPLTR